MTTASATMTIATSGRGSQASQRARVDNADRTESISDFRPRIVRENGWLGALGALDTGAVRWHNAPVATEMRIGDEKFPAENLHLVEFVHLRNRLLDLALRREGR